MESTLSELDLYLLAEGTHTRAYDKLGAHLGEIDGRAGAHFAVWAPDAEFVSVVGDFNQWDSAREPLRPSPAGIWTGFVPGMGAGDIYKYHIRSRFRGYQVDKADPYGFASEIRPRTASRVWDLDSYSWQDSQWMANR